jgi:hypothetical protein
VTGLIGAAQVRGPSGGGERKIIVGFPEYGPEDRLAARMAVSSLTSVSVPKDQPRDEVSFAAPEPIDAGIAIGMPDGEQKETPSGSGRAQGNRQREGRHLWHR